MKARAVSIATAAALAVAVFAVGALGPGLGAGPSARPGTVAVSFSGDPFLVPASAGGSLDAAIASLESRVEAVPDDWRASAALGSAYVQQGRVTGDPSAYPLAQAALRRSLALRPTGNAGALVGLGTLAAARHDFADALRWGRRAVRAAPFDADAYGVLGDAQLELGRYRAAFASFQRMVDTRPDLASYARVSYALELRGNVAGAIDAMRAAFDLAAGGADAAWTAAKIGQLHFGAGRVGEAEAWFRRALAADPRSMDAEAGLALVAWARGDLRGGIGGFERVSARFPSPEHVATLGELYAAAGDREAAAAQFELVRAEARLFRVNGVDTDLEIALFEADRPGSGSAHERPRRRRPRLGPLRERALPGGRHRVGPGAPARHEERPVPVPRGDDQPPARRPRRREGTPGRGVRHQPALLGPLVTGAPRDARAPRGAMTLPTPPPPRPPHRASPGRPPPSRG